MFGPPVGLEQDAVDLGEVDDLDAVADGFEQEAVVLGEVLEEELGL